MNYNLLAMLVASLTLTSVSSANVTDTQTNYGDPTASYRGLGIQASDDAYQAVGVLGFGEHIASFELGRETKNRAWSYRARYFNVDQNSGFGWSVDLLGSEMDTASSMGGMLGLVQKYSLGDNVILVPMLATGLLSLQQTQASLSTQSSTWVAQPGLYALYAFDAGHWLYANPKSTYVHKERAWSTELEVGGGYLLTDNSSVGFKYEAGRFNGQTESKGWINAYYYF